MITRQGGFVLEVKGGRVRREAGVWIFTNARGAETTKHESPFDQASSAMFALQRRVTHAFGPQHRLAEVLFGHGVVFPDIPFESVGVDADPRQVCDVRDRAQPFDRYVQRLTEFARERDSRPHYGLRESDIAELVEFLRGDFRLVPAFEYTANDLRRSLLQLTESQYAALDAIRSRPRVLVEGAAGTGKTLLALEAARRAAHEGKTVLLLCYNKLLAARLKASLRDETSLAITVSHVHGYMRDVVDGSQIRDAFEKQQAGCDDRSEVFDRLYPEAAALALSAEGATKYDVLIVDEAQDLLSEGFLRVLDESVVGGIAEGRWRVFLDANKQAGVYGRLEHGAVSELESCSKGLILTENCRNTIQVATTATILTNPEVPE